MQAAADKVSFTYSTFNCRFLVDKHPIGAENFLLYLDLSTFWNVKKSNRIFILKKFSLIGAGHYSHPH